MHADQYPPPLISIGASVNSMFSYHQAGIPSVNPVMSSRTQTYGYSIPPLLQVANQPQSTANNPAHPNQACSTRSTYLARIGSSTILGSEGTQPHQEQGCLLYILTTSSLDFVLEAFSFLIVSVCHDQGLTYTKSQVIVFTQYTHPRV